MFLLLTRCTHLSALTGGAGVCQVPDRRQPERDLRALRRHLPRRAEAIQLHGA